MLKHPFKHGVILTKHHIHAKVRGGILVPQNTLRLWDYKHHNWHKIFDTKNLHEIILQLDKFHMRHSQTEPWRVVFGRKPLWHVRILLIRVLCIKMQIKKRHVSERY